MQKLDQSYRGFVEMYSYMLSEHNVVAYLGLLWFQVNLVAIHADRRRVHLTQGIICIPR